MSEETVTNPAGDVPPVLQPFGSAADGTAATPPAAPAPAADDTTAATIKLKPVIRRPMIRKPGTPAAAAPAAPAVPPAPAAEPSAKSSTANLKSVTGPIPAQAVLRKTGIIAEGILTPAQAQAAKSKTSRISLESAMGVAPVASSPAPLKTIRLRRPTDVAKPSAAASAAAPSEAQTEQPAGTGEPDVAVTQKKTLKLQRPGVQLKRPTLGIRKPDAASSAADTQDPQTVPGDLPVADMTPVADLGDVPELKPLSPLDLAAAEPEKSQSAGVPTWLAVVSSIASLAALAVLGVVVWYLFTEGCGPDAGPNAMAFIQM